MLRKLFSELRIGDEFVFKNGANQECCIKKGHRLYRRDVKGAGITSLYNPHEVVYMLLTYGHRRLAALKRLSKEEVIDNYLKKYYSGERD